MAPAAKPRNILRGRGRRQIAKSAYGSIKYLVHSMSLPPYPDLALIMASTGVKVNDIDRRVRILIADDHPVIRKRVRSTLEQYPRFEVCGEARDGSKAIEEAQKLIPDVVILNVSMPVLNGFEAAREIKTSLPDTAIVILSSHTDQRFI